MNHLHLDFETTSRVDLKKTGSWRYALDASTRVLCVAWAWDSDPVRVNILPTIRDIGGILAGRDGPVTLHAWNAMFERDVLRHCFGILPTSWSCTMQRAAYCGLPMRLEHAAKAIHSPFLKSTTGHRLMLQMSRPKKDGSWLHEDKAEGKAKLAELAAYCVSDVEAERAIAERLPELPPQEQRIATLDEAVNTRGLRIDLKLVDRLLALSKEETELLNAECAVLTLGEVTSPGTQSARLLEWFANYGFDLKGVGKDEMKELLDLDPDDVDPTVRQVALIRQRIAKSSTKKLVPLRDAAGVDDRIRGTLQYYGARTGRWGGRLIQPQNLPSRGTLKNANEIIDDLLRNEGQILDADYVRTFWGEPMLAVSSCLRGCIVPTEGNIFYCFDFSQIEARCLAWESGQKDVLDIFESGEDIYLAAMRDFQLRDRDMAKATILGLGFGMSAEKFVDYCIKGGVDIDLPEATRIVGEWRDSNRRIVDFWYSLDKAVKALVYAGKGTTQFHDLTLNMNPKAWGLLSIGMPNGARSLYYHSPRLVRNATTGRDDLIYDGVDPISKQWLPIRTWGSKLVENITQGVARDVMIEAAMRVEQRFENVGLVLSVHDELLFEVDDRDTDHDKLFKDVLATLTERPAWAPDLPVDAKGKILRDRYGK